MAAPMRYVCKKKPPVSFWNIRLMKDFLVACREYLHPNLYNSRQLIRNLSTMQSMRIPTQKVHRPFPNTNDEVEASLYKLKKNLQLRRYIPIIPFSKVCKSLEDRRAQGEPVLSSGKGSELLSMTGEVLNVTKFRRKRTTTKVWNLLKSWKGYTLDLSNYTNYVMACKENEMMVDVTNLQEEMRQAGLSQDQEFFEELIGYHSAHGELDCVKRLLKEMRSANFQMTAKTASNYIWGAFNAGCEDEMSTIFESMGSYGILPDLNCYMTMMKCYAVKGDLKKINQLIKRAESEAGMRRVHQLQLLLPLLMNGHEIQAEKVLDVLCMASDVDKEDKAEIEYHGNQLVVHSFLPEGFKVYNLSQHTAVFFIRSFARGLGMKSNVHFEGSRKINKLAAKLTIKMVQDNVITLNRMFLEAKTISKDYMTCVVMEMKKQGIVESQHQFSSMIESEPCSSHLNDQSKKTLLEIGKACFDNDKPAVEVTDTMMQENAAHRGHLNDDEVLRRFVQIKLEGSVKTTMTANILRQAYMYRKKFKKAIYYQNEMIRAMPSFAYNINRVTFLMSKMLESDEHDGIVQCIKDFSAVVREMKSDMAVIQPDQLTLILKILVNFLNPAEVLQITEGLTPLQRFIKTEKKTFLRLYLQRSCYYTVLTKLVRYDDPTLIDKVYSTVKRREGENSANVLQTCAYLMNYQVQKARQICETPQTHQHVRFSHIKACLCQLQDKPHMLSEFVELQDSPLLRKILSEVLKRDTGSSYGKVKQVITEYIITNPDSTLSTVCSHQMEATQLELEKLKLSMTEKV
ncbi:uncharacterized protein LOC132553111 [Ylistrum balloti]|uniref:uncharacterized protein LOC132553111 n=1 Tax=Ylistrum balloti TaxID=509963 RepID=UPI002905D78B|nr:uncharacterized protein LOC132553111 [Ylistrum balloti]